MGAVKEAKGIVEGAQGSLRWKFAHDRLRFLGMSLAQQESGLAELLSDLFPELRIRAHLRLRGAPSLSVASQPGLLLLGGNGAGVGFAFANQQINGEAK